MSKSNDLDFIDAYAPRTRRTTRQMTKNLQEALPRGRGRGDFAPKPTKNTRRNRGRGRGRAPPATNFEDEYSISENDGEEENNSGEDSENFAEDDDLAEEDQDETPKESDSDDSFEEFIKNKSEEKKKEQQQDLTKMTRRQKTAYLVKNNILDEVKEETVTKKSGRINLSDETVLYSLDSSKTKSLRSEMRPRHRKHKVVTIEEQAEKQTVALKKILEEIAQKEKDKEARSKEQKKQKKQQEENDALEGRRRAKLNCVRTLYKINSTGENEGERSMSCSVSFPKGYQMPEVLRQYYPSAARVEEKSRQEKCDNCQKNYRKYLCKMTGKISCSFECYKENKRTAGIV